MLCNETQVKLHMMCIDRYIKGLVDKTDEAKVASDVNIKKKYVRQNGR